MTEPLRHATATPFPPLTCPGFDPAVCPELAQSAALGYPSPPTVATLRAASMVTYGSSVHAPTLLMQGENDTLFNINEAVANYNQLPSNHTPVKLVLQSWGHSGLTPAPGEVDYTDGARGYETQLIADWFAKYLGHRQVSTGPAVEYYRDWGPHPRRGVGRGVLRDGHVLAGGYLRSAAPVRRWLPHHGRRCGDGGDPVVRQPTGRHGGQLLRDVCHRELGSGTGEHPAE